jgi:hypothetical protein
MACPNSLRLKIKLKGRHFGTSEVTGAESQAVLNTRTEYDFEGAFKKKGVLGMICKCGRGLLRG